MLSLLHVLIWVGLAEYFRFLQEIYWIYRISWLRIVIDSSCSLLIHLETGIVGYIDTCSLRFKAINSLLLQIIIISKLGYKEWDLIQNMCTLLLPPALFRITCLFPLLIIVVYLLRPLSLLLRCGHLNVLCVKLAISLCHFILICSCHLQIIMHHDSLLELWRVICLGGHPQM